MTTVLSHDAMQELEWHLELFVDMDSKIEKEPFPLHEYGGYGTGCDDELLSAGMVATNPESLARHYITQAGADYLNATIKIITPFDAPDTPTPPNAEIEGSNARLHTEVNRLNKLLATLERAYNGLGGMYTAALEDAQAAEHPAITALRNLDIDGLDPLDALIALHDLKRRVK